MAGGQNGPINTPNAVEHVVEACSIKKEDAAIHSKRRVVLVESCWYDYPGDQKNVRCSRVSVSNRFLFNRWYDHPGDVKNVRYSRVSVLRRFPTIRPSFSHSTVSGGNICDLFHRPQNGGKRCSGADREYKLCNTDVSNLTTYIWQDTEPITGRVIDIFRMGEKSHGIRHGYGAARSTL